MKEGNKKIRGKEGVKENGKGKRRTKAINELKEGRRERIRGRNKGEGGNKRNGRTKIIQRLLQYGENICKIWVEGGGGGEREARTNKNKKLSPKACSKEINKTNVYQSVYPLIYFPLHGDDSKYI